MRYPLLLLLMVSLVYAQETGKKVSVERVKKDLSYLGSDLFEGRGTGTTGGELSAKYLAKEFDEAGLTPGGDNETFYQYIPMHGAVPRRQSELKLYTSGNDTVNLKYPDDYVLYKSGQQTFTPAPLPIVFAGYGITAPEFDYNDYYDLDVEGKIVVVIEGEPISEDPSYFEGEIPTIYSYAESKLRTALSRGAAGTIIITNPYVSPVDWNHIRRDFTFEDVRLAYSTTANLSILMYHEQAEKLFDNSGHSLEEVFIMHSEKKIKSFPLHTKLTFRGVFKSRDFLSPNIIGIRKGYDDNFKDRYIVISAHYDHLGTGPAVNGDSVYNGVLDNAIGSAALTEIARVMNENNIRTKRSIIFLLVTGEEKGLLGSTYYIDHPYAPLYKTDANINIDGIAYIDRFKSIVGVGHELSSLGNILEQTATEHNLSITDIPSQFKSWESFNRSDQMAFAKGGIPSILIMEGPDFINYSREEALGFLVDYNTEIYHTLFDDLNIEINYEAVKQHINLLLDYITDVADSETNPVWNDGVSYKILRLRSIAEKR